MAESERCELVLNAVFYWEPVEFFQKRCDMTTLRFFQDEPYGSSACANISMSEFNKFTAQWDLSEAAVAALAEDSYTSKAAPYW